MSTLHEYVSKDILPAELGGEGPSFNPTLWSDKLLEESLRNAEDPVNELSEVSGSDSSDSSTSEGQNTSQACVR